MSGDTRRTVGEGLAAHVGDRLSRRWAVGMSGRKGSLLQRLGVDDPWAPSEGSGPGADARARREARMADRLARFDKMTGMRAAFRRVGGSALAPRFGFDLSSLIFPRILEDAPAQLAPEQQAAQPGRSPSAWVGARRSESPWLSPKGGPARVIRGQRSVHAPTARSGRAPRAGGLPHGVEVSAPHRNPALRAPALAVAAPGFAGAAAAAPRGARPSRAAAQAIASAVRPGAARALARRAAAAPEAAPEALLRAVLGPAARLIDDPMTDGVADRSLPAARLAAARLADPGQPARRARGLRPVLSRSPSVEAVVRAPSVRSAVDDASAPDASGAAGAPPALRRLSASPVRASARQPRPRTPQRRATTASAAGLGVVARAAQRDADPADPAAARAPRADAPATMSAAVERPASPEPRDSAFATTSSAGGSAGRSGPRLGAPSVPLARPASASLGGRSALRADGEDVVDSAVGEEAAPRARATAAALDRWVDPTPPADERAARIELREGRFARAARRAALAPAPSPRAPRAGAAAPSATFALAPVAATDDSAAVSADAPAAAARAPSASPRRITGAAAWASRRLDVGSATPGSVLTRPTAHAPTAARPRAAASAGLGARPWSVGASAAPAARGAGSGSAEGASAPRGASDQAARPAGRTVASADSTVQAVGQAAAQVAGRAAAAPLPRTRRLVEVASPLSAVEHVLERSAVGARAVGSTLPVTMPRAARGEAVRRLSTPAPGVLPAPAPAALEAVAAEGAVSRAVSARPSVLPVAAAAPRTVAQLRAEAAPPGPRPVAAAVRPVRAQAEVAEAAGEPRARAVERAARRLEVLDAPALASVVPAPAAAARADLPLDARPLSRAARAAAAPAAARAAASPRRAVPAPVATTVVPDPTPAAAEPRSAQADAPAARGAAPSPGASRPAAPPAERALVRAVAHAAARVGLTLSPDTELPVAVERLAAATARVERAERSALPRPTARPDRAARAQLAQRGDSLPRVVFAQPGLSPVDEAASAPVGAPARSAQAPAPRGGGSSARGLVGRPAARPASARGSASTHAVARPTRAPAATRAARQGLSTLSASARAAVVSLLRRRARPSALGYARLAAGGPALGAAPERFTVAGDARRAEEAGGVEVQLRRAPVARPLDFVDVRAGHELSAPELSARGAGRVTSVFRTPFGDVEVPALGGAALAGAPGVRQGRHLTRTAEGRYLPTAAALAAGLVLPQVATAPEGGVEGAVSAAPAVALGGAARPLAPRATVAARAPRADRSAAPEGSARVAASAPAAVVAQAASPQGVDAAAQQTVPGAAPVGRAPVRGFAPRPDLRAVLGAVDQGHAERGLPVWARRASGEPLARGTGGDFVQSLAAARSEEDVVRVIVEQGGALSQVGSSLPKPVIQVIEHIRGEARAELEARVDQARTVAPEGTLPDATRTRREPRHAATRENVQVVKALTGLKGGGGARKAQGVGDDRVMKLARKLQQLIHLAEGAGDRDAARRQVRMAEDSAQARAEGQGPGGTAESGSTKQVDIEALGREVLEMVSRELEMRRERRQEDPDGRNVWW